MTEIRNLMGRLTMRLDTLKRELVNWKINVIKICRIKHEKIKI